MPRYEQPTRIASVLGDLREGLSRHTFIGGNFFMLRMLNRFRNELGVAAQPSELEASANGDDPAMQQDSATVCDHPRGRRRRQRRTGRRRAEPGRAQAARAGTRRGGRGCT